MRYRQHSGSVSHGVFARSGADARELKRRRYLRTAAFLQGTADDLAHCLTQLPNLEAGMIADARRLQRMYSGAARMRQALVTGDFAERWSAMCSALAQPGNRRRALEYASKLWRK